MVIPNDAADFSVEWLNSVLTSRRSWGNTRVTSCEVTESDYPGQTAEIYFLQVGYDSNDPDLPTNLVAKVTSRNPVVLDEIIANFDQYRREVAFYNEIDDVGIGVPECLYAAHDPGSQRFVLLMRDLAPASSPSWGIAPDQVEAAASKLPAFHARWWNDPVLKSKDWIVQPDDALFFGRAFGGADQARPRLSELYDAPELSQEIMATAAGKVEKLLAFQSSRPFTFVHGDYHAKQMFLPTAQGGDFAVIDWQFPFVAQGPWDLSRLVGVCLSTEERQAREPALVDAYRTGLAAGGVSEYSQDEFRADYQYGLVMSQLIMCIASVSTDPELFRIECETFGLDWRDVIFERNQRALDEWDALSLIKQI